ncbi:hypothetical protein [Nitrosopumilus sp.]|uniref:hypothetical protein n=1 Tax=Nitrosopumilus sp. TaxID=2024843 RepID=UPI003D0D8B74
MSGLAGLKFADDIIKLLSDKWRPGSGGKRPTFSKAWRTKTVNVGTNSDENIIVMLDSDNPNIFSLQYKDADSNPIFDWLHDLSVSLDVRTGKSEDRVEQMVDEVYRILKTNVAAPTVNNRQYVQLLPGQAQPMLEDFKNYFRYVVDVEAMRLNP